jgi:alkaline phosphatase
LDTAVNSSHLPGVLVSHVDFPSFTIDTLAEA